MTRLIDADALKEVITAKYNSTDYGMFTTGIMEIIDNAPTVDTDLSKYSDKLWKEAYERGKNERPHGEWKDITPNHYFTCGGKPLVICPFCGDQESKHVQGIENHMWKFCPNCGADMRGDKE